MRVPVQALNNRAKDKYQELRHAMEMVRIALDEAAKLHKKITEPHDRFAGWRVPSKEEVVSAHRKAAEQLNTLHGNTKKWEKELTSRGWRV